MLWLYKDVQCGESPARDVTWPPCSVCSLSTTQALLLLCHQNRHRKPFAGLKTSIGWTWNGERKRGLRASSYFSIKSVHFLKSYCGKIHPLTVHHIQDSHRVVHHPQKIFITPKKTLYNWKWSRHAPTPLVCFLSHRFAYSDISYKWDYAICGSLCLAS